MVLLYLGPPETLPLVKSVLAPTFDVRLALDEQGVDDEISDAEVVLDASMRVRFSHERLARAPRLRLFVTATTGADHVDAQALAERSIPLWTLRDHPDALEDVTAAAEHSWLLLMACARHLPAAARDVLEGIWDRQRHPGMMLRGRTLGLIGCGRIGRWMSRYATAFSMRCLGYDPYVSIWPSTIIATPLAELLPVSDVVSVHVPLTDETRGFINGDVLARMKPGVIFINTSRGDVVDELALLAALQAGHVAAAGLDVLRGEPDVGQHPLISYARTHPNVIITPHIAGFSPDALRVVLEFSCRRIRAAFDPAQPR